MSADVMTQSADLLDMLAAEDVIGVLTRETRVRLVNISASGCLLETTLRLEPGTVGQLKVVIDGDTFGDAVRVARVQQVHGAGAEWHLGAEFLWTTHPGSRSLRRMVSRLRREIAQQAVDVELVSGRRM